MLTLDILTQYIRLVIRRGQTMRASVLLVTLVFVPATLGQDTANVPPKKIPARQARPRFDEKWIAQRWFCCAMN
jgi:hypothetical protein